MTIPAGETLPPLLLVGAGRMGGAMFAGWAARGLAPSALIDPNPAPGLARPQDILAASVADLPSGFSPAAVILAVKPQMADAVLPALRVPAGAVVLSIMAGKTLAGLAHALGGAPVVRAMPNTPAAIGMGMTVAVAAEGVTPPQRALCDTLLGAVGDVAWLPDETLMSQVTSVSGCGPAYVFLLAELLEQAGAESGLPADLARRLARRTVAGAAALMAAGEEDAAALRRAVTSPKGVTERALQVLMAEDAWPASIRLALRRAVERDRELGGPPG